MKPGSSQRFYGVSEQVEVPHRFEAMVVGATMLAALTIMLAAAIWQWVAG